MNREELINELSLLGGDKDWKAVIAACERLMGGRGGTPVYDIDRSLRRWYEVLRNTRGLGKPGPLDGLWKRKKLRSMIEDAYSEMNQQLSMIADSEGIVLDEATRLRFYMMCFQCISLRKNSRVSKHKGIVRTLYDVTDHLYEILDESYPGYVDGNLLLRFTGVSLGVKKNPSKIKRLRLRKRGAVE